MGESGEGLPVPPLLPVWEEALGGGGLQQPLQATRPLPWERQVPMQRVRVVPRRDPVSPTHGPEGHVDDGVPTLPAPDRTLGVRILESPVQTASHLRAQPGSCSRRAVDTVVRGPWGGRRDPRLGGMWAGQGPDGPSWEARGPRRLGAVLTRGRGLTRRAALHVLNFHTCWLTSADLERGLNLAEPGLHLCTTGTLPPPSSRGFWRESVR